MIKNHSLLHEFNTLNAAKRIAAAAVNKTRQMQGETKKR